MYLLRILTEPRSNSSRDLPMQGEPSYRCVIDVWHSILSELVSYFIVGV